MFHCGKYTATDLELARRMFEKLKSGEDVRQEKIAHVKRCVASKQYDEDRKVDFILDRVLEEIND